MGQDGQMIEYQSAKFVESDAMIGVEPYIMEKRVSGKGESSYAFDA
jgi:hypothetical protein